MDADGSGEIDVSELLDPMMSLGLAQSRDEVRALTAHKPQATTLGTDTHAAGAPPDCGSG